MLASPDRSWLGRFSTSPGKRVSRRYRIDRLVYFETFRYVSNAIARETEIKAWRREKKVVLIAANNPTWEDLAADWESGSR